MSEAERIRVIFLSGARPTATLLKPTKAKTSTKRTAAEKKRRDGRNGKESGSDT